MSPRRLPQRAPAVTRRLEAVGDALQATAVELALAAPFLSLRDLARWRRQIATWQGTAVQAVAALARLDAILARYTAGRDAVRTVSA